METIVKLLDTVCGGMIDKGFNADDVYAASSCIGTMSNWTEVKRNILTCTQCKLSCKRKVLGYGPIRSPLMIVGESPDELESLMSLPLAGEGGHLLTIVLNKLGIHRETIYITNAIKCKPENDHVLSFEELTICQQHLQSEILYVKPEIIIALGTSAVRAIFNNPSLNISMLRGNLMEYGISHVMPTYHPAYVLRQFKDSNVKSTFWYDIKLAIDKIDHNQKE